MVARIAPPTLIGRESELGELAGFCTAPAGASYAWWRASAWAGKSALMATFALSPPPGVRVVPFFVTARYAAQNDRVAFADIVITQLTELLAEPFPNHLTDATRDMFLLESLDRAAASCAAKGERLVLLLDGLDEDRGVTVGDDAHSIAALLPPRPVAGMRVIVAGRPNPPIPTDVGHDHPLRDPTIVRPLEPSPHAAVIRNDMLRELRRMLRGSAAEQALLGMLTAAGGGLSAHDLSELTGLDRPYVEEHLAAVTGRSFATRPSAWQVGADPDVYVLGHEELQNTAATAISSELLADYRRKLHDWADRYRSHRWPRQTPEYLLRGYFRLLQAVGDFPRMLACATDEERHDRMLDISGGDLAALAEITSAMDAAMAVADPDLLAMSLLARRRDQLMARNSRIPAELPAVWESLGRPARAETVAHSITDLPTRCRALIDVAIVAERRGDRERARTLIDDASAMAGTEPKEYRRSDILRSLQRGLRAAEESRRARAATVATVSPGDDALTRSRQAWALSRAPELMAYSGELTEAMSVARSVTDPCERIEALTRLGKIMLVQGDTTGALLLARGVEGVARADRSVRALSDAAVFLAMCQAVSRAEKLITLITDRHRREWASLRLIRTVAAGGDHRRARAMAASLDQTYLRAWALIDIAGSLAGHPGSADAAELLDQAASLIDRVGSAEGRAWLSRRRSAASRGLDAGQTPEELNLTATRNRWQHLPERRAYAMKDLMAAVAVGGDRDRVRALARWTYMLAKSMPARWDMDTHLLTEVAAILAARDDPEQAAEYAVQVGVLARTSVDQRAEANVWIEVLSAVTKTGRLQICAELADHAEAAVRAIDSRIRDYPLAQLVEKVAATGDLTRARALASDLQGDGYPVRSARHALTDPAELARSKVALAEAVAGAGDYASARAMARSVDEPRRRDWLFMSIARSAAINGVDEQVRRSLESVTDKALLTSMCTPMADLVVNKELYHRIAGIADVLAGFGRRNDWFRSLAYAIAHTRDYDRAVAMVRLITGSDDRRSVFGFLVAAASRRGDHAQATRLVDAPANREYRDAALAHLARIAAEQGNTSKVDDLTAAITDRWERDLLLGHLAEEAERRGETARADRLLDAITEMPWRAPVTERLLTMAVLVDDRQRAVALGRRITHLPDEQTIRPRALLLALDGRYGQAVALARTLDEHMRCRIQADIGRIAIDHRTPDLRAPSPPKATSGG